MFLGSLTLQTIWKNVFLSKKKKTCIVLGDFNFDILKLVGSSRVWLELMDSFNPFSVGCQTNTNFTTLYSPY